MEKNRAKVMIAMLLCVVVGFTIIIYSVAAQKGSQSSGKDESLAVIECEEETSVPASIQRTIDANMAKLMPVCPQTQLKEDTVVILGKKSSKTTIPKGSIVYLDNHIIEVYDANDKCILKTLDSESDLVDTPNGKISTNHVFTVPDGSFIKDNGNEIIVYDSVYKDSILLRIVNLSESATRAPISKGWIAGFYDSEVASLGYFSADWTVPNEPVDQGTTQFYFNGIQDNKPDTTIIQPVLEWNTLDGGVPTNRWTGCTWYAPNNNFGFKTGSRIDCSVGDNISGVMVHFDTLWAIGLMNRTTDENSALYIESGSMPFSNLGIVCALENGGIITQPEQEIIGSCFFENIILTDGGDTVDVEWEPFREPAAMFDVSFIYDPSHYDDSWLSILTSNGNDNWVDVYVDLQGANRPIPEGWRVPIGVGFYPPNSDDATLLNPNAATYYFNGTTNFYGPTNGTRAYYHCPGQVDPGTYDITVDSTTTLLNVKREVQIPYLCTI